MSFVLREGGEIPQTGTKRITDRWSNETGRVLTGRYGVVPKGLLTFLGSLSKEGAKTTSGTLVYRFERQTSRKKFLPSKKRCVLNLE